MKLELIDMFKAAHGKVCQDSAFYTAHRNGKTYTGRICHPYKGPKSDKQQTATDQFSAATIATNNILKSGKGDTQYDKYLADFKANPGKYATLRGYIFAQEYKKI